MLSEHLCQSLIDDIFSPEAEGVRITPGPVDGQLTIDYIDNHYVHGIVDDGQTYFDFVRHGALKWLYEQNNSQAKKIAELEEQVVQLRHLKFGTSSEQSTGATADEPAPEEQTDPVADPQSNANDSKEPTARNAGRKGLPAHLRREPKTYVATACPCCHGDALHVIGEETTEQLTIVPIQVKVIQHRRKKYRCRHCDKVFTAEAPKYIIEKSSYASPEFLAHVACSKYQFGLPLYRQEQIFKQMNVPINRTTLANLMIGCADRLVALYAILHDELLRQHVIHADETPFQVLKEPGRKATTKSQLWLYRSGNREMRQIVLFEYQATRAGEHPRRFLGIDGTNPYRGRLLADAYAGYNDLPGVTRHACLSHVRRKFENFIRLLPEKAKTSQAQYAMELIGRLYGIERRIKGMPDRERQKIRQEESLPILHEFKKWLDKMEPKMTPKSALGAAIRYAVGQWPAIVRYVEDGRVAIDNNIAERDIKSVVIGRKNWLFADSVAGAHTNAIMYSLVETAKANDLNPFDYLTYVIETMPTLRKASDVQCLLPWNIPQPSLAETLKAA